MKRSLLIMVLGLAGCGGPPPAPPAVTDTSDQFTFVVDHPPILTGQSEVTVFEVPVENRTPDVVKFGKPSCHCTCSETVLPRQELAPGESMTVRVVARAAERVGEQRFTCYWADDRDRQWTATVRADLCRPEQFDRDRLSFGAVEAGGRLTGEARYRQHANRVEDLPPVPTFRADDPAVEVTAGPAEVRELRPGLVCRETPVAVAAVPSSRVGYTGTRVSPDATRLPFAAGTTLLVEWTLKPAVTVSPSRVVFLDGDTTPRRQRIVLYSADGGPFEVVRATVPGDAGVTAAVGDGAGDRGKVVDVAVAGRVTKAAAGDIVIETTHPRARTLTVPFAVVVLPPGAAGGSDPSAK